jgi:hypothetical protein
MKLSKLIYRIDLWARRFSSKKEKALAVSDEHKDFVRAKRNKTHLPDSWTDTRWIPKIQSWKSRAKTNHQYEKHVQSEYELNYFYNNLKLKQDFLYKLITLYKKDGIGWYYFRDPEDIKFIMPSEKNYYDIAVELCKEGIVIGDLYTKSWSFNDFGVDKTYTQDILLKCRINPDIL